MKKIFFTLLAVVFFSNTIFTQTIQDVPTSHWAYKSIQKLVSRGYLALYDDKTFRGDLPVSRLIFASVIGKLIDDIENGTIKVTTGDLKEIKKLSMEFKNELADYEVKIALLEKQLQDLDASKIIAQRDLAKITYELREQDEKMQEMISENQKKTEEEIAKLKEELKKSEAKRKKMQKWLVIGILASAALGTSK